MARLGKAQAAEAAGRSPAALRNWEKGDTIALPSVHALADVYGANPEWIISGEGEMLASDQPSDEFLDGLRALEGRVDRLDKLVDDLATALVEESRWQQVEDRLNLLSAQMRAFAEKVPDVDAPVESPLSSPIDLTPEGPKP